MPIKIANLPGGVRDLAKKVDTNRDGSVSSEEVKAARQGFTTSSDCYHGAGDADRLTLTLFERLTRADSPAKPAATAADTTSADADAPAPRRRKPRASPKASGPPTPQHDTSRLNSSRAENRLEPVRSYMVPKGSCPTARTVQGMYRCFPYPTCAPTSVCLRRFPG